jgi:hypothetical protein
MKYVIHFIGGKEMIINEEFINRIVNSHPKDMRFMTYYVDSKFIAVVNINNITHIEPHNEEGYF